MKDKKLHYVYNYLGREKFKVTSKEEVHEGQVTLRFEFEPTGKPKIREGKGTPGRGQLYINGKLVGNADIPVTAPISFGLASFATCGQGGSDSVVPEDYHGSFTFTGKIHRVVVDISGELIVDREAELKAAMVRD
jgi:arylsulfatase